MAAILADDYPIRLTFSIRRRRFKILQRRALRNGRSVETEASHLLESALLALVRGDGAFDERVPMEAGETDGARLSGDPSELRRLILARLDRDSKSAESSESSELADVGDKQ